MNLLIRVLLAGVISGVVAGAATPRERPDFGLVYNDDADLSFVVPDRTQSEALLQANLQALADTPVRTLVYCIGMGGDVLYYNTQVASRVGWRTSADEKPGSLLAKRMENARVCLAAGADAVRTAGETARRLGLRFIPSLRMNDAHFMVKPDDHPMTSEFWFRHRDRFTIKTSPLAFQPAYGNLLDYTHAEVRQLRLATVQEVLARNRDLVDGFELDFNRFQVFFPRGGATRGAPLMTELVRSVRAELDRVSREVGRPLYLFVRTPPSLDDCTAAGLAVPDWIREGLVDLISPAQLMTLAGDMPISDLIRVAHPHGVRVHPSLYPRTSWRLPFPVRQPDRYAGAIASRDASLEEIRGAAAVYRTQGVDGFYLFNFYNAFGAVRPHDDRLYHVFRDLARPDNATGQAVVYSVTKRYYHDGPDSYAYGKPLPARLIAGQPLSLLLPTGTRVTDSPFPLAGCEARLGFRALPDDARITVTFNGVPLYDGTASGAVSVATTPYLAGARKPADLADFYLHLPLPQPESVQPGPHRWTISVSNVAPATEITDLEVRFDFQNDLEELWERKPPG
ncbi:MAG: hypothetical protein U1F61_03205 [Opitutaceae bacterium]